MNSRSTILVLILAIGLGTYITLYEVGQNPSDTHGLIDSPGMGTPLLPAGRLPVDRIRTIRIESPAHDLVVLETDPGQTKHWWQTKPIRYPARLEAITELIDTIRALRFARSLDPAEAQRADLTGLSPESETRYTLSGEDFAPLTLALGQSTGAGAAYLRLGDSQSVYVVNDDLHRRNQSPKAWRDNTLTGIAPEGIQVIHIEDRSDGNLKIQRMAGGWQITAPQTDRADIEQVQALLKSLRETRVIDFVADHPESLTPFGLDQPTRTLSFHTKATDDTSVVHRLILGTTTTLESTQRFAMIEGTPSVFTLPGSILLNTSAQAEHYRDRRLALMRPEDLQTLTITSSQPPLALARQDGHWIFADQKNFVPDPALLDRLLREVFGNRADGFGPATGTPASDVLQVELIGLTAEQHEQLQIQREGEYWWVTRQGETIARRLPKSRLSLITRSASELRDRTVTTLAADMLKSIRITSHGTTFTLTRETDGQWPAVQYEKAAIEALLGQLTPLRAAAWIAETPAEWIPTFTVSFEQADGTATILEARPGDQPPTARLGRQDGLFQLEPATAESLRAEFRHRMILNVERKRIASVSTADWTLLHDTSGKLLLGDDTKADAVRAAAIIDSIAGLRAVRYHAPDTVQFKTGTPSNTLTIALRDGSRHTLKLWSPDVQNAGVWIGRLNDTGLLFELEPAAAASLISSPRP